MVVSFLDEMGVPYLLAPKCTRHLRVGFSVMLKALAVVIELFRVIKHALDLF